MIIAPGTGRRAIHVEAQGTLLAVAKEWDASPPIGGRRGIVTGFSAASRRRLIKKIARLRPKRAVFVTLTYPNLYPSGRRSKDHLRAFFERIRRKFPEASAIWRLEFQERGAPHFHLMIFDMPYVPWRTVRQWWTEIISEYVELHQPRVEIKKIHSQRGCMYYVAKYCSKTSDAVSNLSYLVYSAYLHAGRVWGVHNASCLPFAPLVYITILDQSGRGLAEVKKVLRRRYARIRKNRNQGGSIFTDKAYTLHSDLIRILLAYADCEMWGFDPVELGQGG